MKYQMNALCFVGVEVVFKTVKSQLIDDIRIAVMMNSPIGLALIG